MTDSTRKQLLARKVQLFDERTSWMAHWEEIARNLLPRSGRFFVDDRNKGDKRHNAILDSTATGALNTLAAGLMAGMTSPARPWFRLTTSDPQLDESSGVKQWLADVTRVMQMVFAKSNTYRALHSHYRGLGAFGTVAGVVLPDFRNVIHHYPLPIGEFALATDHRGVVDTLYREYQVTVAQLVREFGADKVSPTVKGLYERGNLGAWVTITQAIEPRVDRDPSKRDPQNMAWRSTYFENGADEDKLLRDAGFKEFRALCPRWDVQTGDIYGESPGMLALGDVKQLQHEQLRKAQGIDYKVRPPLQAPTGMKNMAVDMLPGGISYVDAASPTGGIRNAFEAQIDLSHLLMDIQDVRQRIRSAFHADIFLMMANSTDTTKTATEIAERHEEKMLMMGPIVERLHNEILDPLIEMTFSHMLQAGIVPPAPPELQGMDLNVEFVSMLAQAQRAIATNSVDRYVANLGAVAQFKPEVLDKFNADHWADAYGDMLGIDPELIVPGEQVALIRQQRAQAQQALQQTALAEQEANIAQRLGSINTSQPNALSDITRAFSGYT